MSCSHPRASMIARQAHRVVTDVARGCLVRDVPSGERRVAFRQRADRANNQLRDPCEAATAHCGPTWGDRPIRAPARLSSGMGFATVQFMLTIGDDLLPQTDLTYFAFRVAFCDTLERITLAEQARMGHDVTLGYLTEVPFLRNVTPRVQLDLLLETWDRHYADERSPGTLMDEAVIYAACETAARLVKSDGKSIRRFLRGGPRPLFPVLDERLAESLHALH